MPVDALSRRLEGQNSGEQEKVEVDGTATLDEVMTPYPVNAVGFEQIGSQTRWQCCRDKTRY